MQDKRCIGIPVLANACSATAGEVKRFKSLVENKVLTAVSKDVIEKLLIVVSVVAWPSGCNVCNFTQGMNLRHAEDSPPNIIPSVSPTCNLHRLSSSLSAILLSSVLLYYFYKLPSTNI